MVKINFYEKCKVSTRTLDRFIISGLLLLSILITCFAIVSSRKEVSEVGDIPVQNEVEVDGSTCEIEE